MSQLYSKIAQIQAKQWSVLQKFFPKNNNYVAWNGIDDSFEKLETFMLDQLSSKSNFSNINDNNPLLLEKSDEIIDNSSNANNKQTYSLIVTKYYTNDCDSCKAILRDWIKLSIEYQTDHVLFLNVNCTHCQEISASRSIFQTPT